jgi:hypothetical protein
VAAAAASRKTGAEHLDGPVLVCIRPSGPTGQGAEVEERIAAHNLAAGREAQAATVAEAAAAGPEATLLLRGSARFYNRLLRALGERTSRPRVVLWYLEPLPLPATAPFGVGLPSIRELTKVALRDTRVIDPRVGLRDLVRHVRGGVIDAIVATSLGKVETLAEHGIPASFVPMGSQPLVDCGGERDLETVFVGDIRVPRRRLAVWRLRRAGLDLRVHGAWSRRGLWGDERERVLCRTRVMLNVSRYPGNHAGSRLFLAMRHGAVVVSEPMYRPDPYVPGVHYVEATIDEMLDAVRGLLEDEARRNEIAQAGRELCLRHTEAGAVMQVLAALDGQPSRFSP